MANTKKKTTTKKKNVSKPKEAIKKLASKELTNGAFAILLVLSFVIGGVLGWIIGTNLAYIFK